MAKIRGLQDGKGGKNEHYDIGRRKSVPRHTLVLEIEAGKHSGAHTYERNGQKFVRDNPDSSKSDNVNR